MMNNSQLPLGKLAETRRRHQDMQEKIRLRHGIPQPGDIFFLDAIPDHYVWWLLTQRDPATGLGHLMPLDPNGFSGSLDIALTPQGAWGPGFVHCGICEVIPAGLLDTLKPCGVVEVEDLNRALVRRSEIEDGIEDPSLSVGERERRREMDEVYDYGKYRQRIERASESLIAWIQAEDQGSTSESSSEVTVLLDAWTQGSHDAFDRLWPLIAAEVREQARMAFARESHGHTLQPTAVINEAMSRLLGRRTLHWENRTQFMATLADLMRKVLIDHARQKARIKRGSQVRKASLEDEGANQVPADLHTASWMARTRPSDLLALDTVLKDLRQVDSELCQLVELKFFGGLTEQEMAETLGVSRRTVTRNWKTARLWLRRQLDRAEPEAPPPC